MQISHAIHLTVHAQDSPDCSPLVGNLRTRLVSAAAAAAAARDGTPASRGKPESSARISLQFGSAGDAGGAEEQEAESSCGGIAAAAAAAGMHNKRLSLGAGGDVATADDVNSPMAMNSSRDQCVE